MVSRCSARRTILDICCRAYAKKSERQVCAEVGEVLELVGARHLVVGHNVQRGGRARVLCDGRCSYCNLAPAMVVAWSYC